MPKNPQAMKDPVCGMHTSPDSPHRLTYQDRKIFFCSAACLEKFRQNPERYPLEPPHEKKAVQARARKIDRVAIIGMGSVGSTFSYSLLLSGLAEEIVLINRTKEKAEGEAMDLNHAIPLAHPTQIWAGDYEDCAGADIVVITAGAAQKPGETRLDLAKKNTRIFQKIVPEVVRHNTDGIILITTNPVDVLTYVTWKVSGLPPGRVIGSGTILDTSRFRYLLGRHYGVDPQSTQAYIIGEHGDSEVPVWSLANVAGMGLNRYCGMMGCEHAEETMAEIFRSTRDAAYKIIEKKGATYYAIATALAHIVKAILRDENTVYPVSSLVQDYYGISDVSLSLPAVLNRQGIDHILRLELSQEEIEGLRHSAAVLKDQIRQLDL